MMRNVIVAAMVLSPVLVFAQANSPASTQASKTMQEARLTHPMFAAAAAAAAHPTAPVRVSTGVTAPKLIHTVDLQGDDRSIWNIAGVERTVKVSMIVDETGTPTNLKVISADDVSTEKNVLAAVAQYRFKPGMLSNQPTAVPVNLEVRVEPSTR